MLVLERVVVDRRGVIVGDEAGDDETRKKPDEPDAVRVS